MLRQHSIVLSPRKILDNSSKIWGPSSLSAWHNYGERRNPSSLSTWLNLKGRRVSSALSSWLDHREGEAALHYSHGSIMTGVEALLRYPHRSIIEKQRQLFIILIAHGWGGYPYLLLSWLVEGRETPLHYPHRLWMGGKAHLHNPRA